MIEIEKFRLTNLAIDFSSNEPIWVVSGYFITKGMEKIIGSFTYSTNEKDEYLGANHFVPSLDMHSLSSELMENVHEVIERQIWNDYTKDRAPVK